VALTRQWQRVVIRGVAPADISANPQSLSVPLGKAGVAVQLGPVAFLHGTPSPTVVARAFARFRPAEVLTDVPIASEPGVVLAGTLHLPAKPAHAPFPLVVLIRGHGPNGRGGFPQIIKALTEQGIAALEYDKRGIGQSSGVYKEDLAKLTADATADATAAVAAMRRRADVDGRRIALVGHSQGGVIAPAVAAADPTIAGVVMLAGSVGDGLPYLRGALIRQMVAAGRSEALATPAIDAAITLPQARIDGKDAATIARLRAAVVDRFEAAGFARPQAEGALAMVDTEETRGANTLRSASDMRAFHGPILAVFGTKDPLVIAADEAPKARLALANNPQGQVVVLDGLSHWF
jgi:pimeloyl-ACP methyl ester carboxylesterase